MKYILSIGMLCGLAIGCGGYATRTIQKADRAYIQFVGNTDGASVIIDDGELFPINIETGSQESINRVFEVRPGKRRIRVVRDNRVVVDRQVFVDNNITMEIDIP